jgi:hypothetical protein
MAFLSRSSNSDIISLRFLGFGFFWVAIGRRLGGGRRFV